MDHRLIECSFHSKKDGALLFLDRREPVICADISWISKFPWEHEVLFAPCALTLPSPFEDRESVSSIAEMASSHHKQRVDSLQPMGFSLGVFC